MIVLIDDARLAIDVVADDLWVGLRTCVVRTVAKRRKRLPLKHRLRFRAIDVMLRGLINGWNSAASGEARS